MYICLAFAPSLTISLSLSLGIRVPVLMKQKKIFQSMLLIPILLFDPSTFKCETWLKSDGKLQTCSDHAEKANLINPQLSRG
jgi:hypothetical protein